MTQTTAWRRHRPWVLPILFGIAGYVVPLLCLFLLERWIEDWNGSIGGGLTTLVLLLMALVAPVVFAILAIRNGYRCFRAWRRTKGKYTKKEARTLELATQASNAWEDARRLRSSLVAHQVPPVLTVWGIVPNQGEAFFLDAPAEYARYYGQDVTYWQRGSVYFGRPSFVAAGLVADAVGNATARRKAEALAREQWREWQVSRILVSNQRIVCNAGGRNLSFYFNSTTGLYADLVGKALVLEFESAEPLMLHGIYVPQIAVLAILNTHGEQALIDHPGLAALN
ncbi:hypothetical protein [Arthrobacter celericrescens]|uniref:hypothetical protein n=1 Tax=Arthrobacter celericrescens TaxID=2320851 RepID=UPI000EA24596|nr:hypothetical protein [Arthrobacter celericrescens]